MDTTERKGAGSKKREIIPEICSLKQETCFSSPRAVTFKSGLKSTVDIHQVLKNVRGEDVGQTEDKVEKDVDKKDFCFLL